MIVALIIACEVGFWVLLAAGLGLRYLAKKPALGAAVLLCEPLMELVLLVVTTLDLKNGAEPDWKHGLAALYIGYTVAYGHYTVTWLDGHAAYRLAGGPKPAGAGYGKARAVHEWKLWVRTVIAAAVALALLQMAIWYVGDAGDVSSLRAWQSSALRVAGIHGLIAVGYTIWPKKAPEGAEERPVPAKSG
ncbi:MULTISPECIES: hypothetical protein [Streptomyces]|uniref:Integral membrane protein n=1 Tax=Streptomyces spororaveus TaxID=284039 RepID=A0ABQ3TBC7_9ACTN|nr:MULTISPECIES: hypothetical protein [Streptomyces]MCM9081873.1 hypothetical protein [Streptomyces spororaveus]MCX5303688.1 hypothetical protein [Streptomyces sp. NBC_00160]GHI77708.1 hypothetical protein Sspor_32690 [Streptomyces spororaveus]